VAKRKVFYDEELVRVMYKQGKRLVDIAAATGVSRELLARFLEREGLRKREQKKPVDRNANALVAEEYSKTQSLKLTAISLGMTKQMVRKALIANDTKITRTRYTWDDAFFARDTQESFYFAGFIAADGCIADREYSTTLQIHIKNTDREVLDRFKGDVLFNGPIVDSAGKVRIAITSKSMCKDLERFGIGPRKSFTYSIPDSIKQHPLVWHFLRGLIDGDGWISIRGSLIVGLCGSLDSVAGFADIVSATCSLRKMKAPRRMKSIYAVEYCGDEAKSIISLLYKDAKDGLWLSRKRDVAFTPVVTRSDTRKPVIAIDCASGAERLFESMNDARNHGFHPQAIHRCIRGEYSKHKGFRWRLAEETDGRI
jgi:hypothetical protein